MILDGSFCLTVYRGGLGYRSSSKNSLVFEKFVELTQAELSATVNMLAVDLAIKVELLNADSFVESGIGSRFGGVGNVRSNFLSLSIRTVT